MAIFTSSSHVTVASGKVASLVLERSPHGYQMRAGVFTSSKRTDSRPQRMATLGQLAQLWRTLTDDQRESWIRQASVLPPRPDRIRPYQIGAFQLFVSCNMNLAEVNLGPVLVAAAPSQIARYTVIVNSAVIATAHLDIQLTRVNGPSNQIAWYGSTVIKAGRRNFNGLSFRRFRVSNTIANVNVWSQYVAVLGSPSSTMVGMQTVLKHVVIDPGGYSSEPYVTVVTWA